MNQMNMAGFNAAGNPGLGNMQMPNNAPNGAMRMPEEHMEEVNYEGKLNTYIYGYLCQKGQYESARALKNSGMHFDDGALIDGDINGMNDNMHGDSKDNIDKNRPDDLPDVKPSYTDGNGGSFLLGWFTLFWDMYFAQRKDNLRNKASHNAMQYVQNTQVRRLSSYYQLPQLTP